MTSVDRSEPRQLGDYEVLHQLSAGGMGEVLLARKRGAGGFERLAAIKTIRSDLRAMEQLRAMFLDEAKLLSRLTHPAVAQVYDFGEQDGTLYLVMEYVAGVSFRDLGDDPLPPGVACRMMAQGCRGLHAAHTLEDEAGNPLGVVHRDVSPDNLMLTYGGAVQVLDFGIALMRGRSAPVTDFGTVKGKPPYLSPEQVRGEAVDQRSDVFSASVVLWELLTGEPLFGGDSIYAIGRDVLEKEIPPPSTYNPAVPPELDAVVAQGLARNIDERFQTAQALAEALSSVAGQMKADSLGVFAGRALAEAKKEHRLWLAAIKGGQADKPAGRPSHVMTAQADVDELAGAEEAEPFATTASAEVDDNSAEPGPIRTSPWPALLLAVIAMLSVTGLAWWKLSTRESAVASAVADAAPSMAVDAASVELAPADAGVMPVDAGGISDAAQPRGLRAKPDARPRTRPPRVKPDARLAPAKPDASVQAAVEFGYITVAADPFASVRIDGKNVGNTPIVGRKVSVGPHRVELFTPDTGALRLRRTVDLKADQRIRIVAPKR